MFTWLYYTHAVLLLFSIYTLLLIFSNTRKTYFYYYFCWFHRLLFVAYKAHNQLSKLINVVEISLLLDCFWISSLRFWSDKHLLLALILCIMIALRGSNWEEGPTVLGNIQTYSKRQSLPWRVCSLNNNTNKRWEGETKAQRSELSWPRSHSRSCGKARNKCTKWQICVSFHGAMLWMFIPTEDPPPDLVTDNVMP